MPRALWEFGGDDCLNNSGLERLVRSFWRRVVQLAGRRRILWQCLRVRANKIVGLARGWPTSFEQFGIPKGQTGSDEAMFGAVNAGWMDLGVEGAEHVAGTTSPPATSSRRPRRPPRRSSTERSVTQSSRLAQPALNVHRDPSGRLIAGDPFTRRGLAWTREPVEVLCRSGVTGCPVGGMSAEP